MLSQVLHQRLARFIYTDGFALLPGRVQARWPERQFMRRFLAQQQIDCVLDVGANVGQFGQELRLIGYTGRILSFEPDPVSFRRLEANAAKDGKWNVFNTALGSSEGHLELNLMAEAVYNSFRAPSAAETSADAASNRVVGKVTVKVGTLGDLLPRLQAEYGFARPHLKMDTQGFDLEVFRGARSVLGSIASLQSEVAIKRIYEGSPAWVETISEYQAEGFEVAGLYAVNPHRRELAELDCFMRKST